MSITIWGFGKEREFRIMTLRAIDMYSGIGGWSVALRSLDVEVVASYDIWEKANQIHRLNHEHHIITQDLLKLDFEELPKDVDIVVGSPPCTEFSYANRGGSGDIDQGLAHISRFLSIVDYIRPKFWAMENVPRVGRIFNEEIRPGGRLHQFQHLAGQALILDSSEFGLPQRRRRCIVGNFDNRLLEHYKHQVPAMTLGDVVHSLRRDEIRDPIYRFRLNNNLVSDRETPEPLNKEEHRINKASKTLHPVYNQMSFPDNEGTPSRTVTATCTNVSRESIVIPVSVSSDKIRRLSVRERSTLQGFPINYSFGDSTEAQKVRMIGNAIPPPLANAVLCALLGKSTLEPLKWKSPQAPRRVELTPRKRHNSQSNRRTTFPATRAFRFAIPVLRYGSGVRFELTNNLAEDRTLWIVRLVYGTPKSIRSLMPNTEILNLTKAVLERHLPIEEMLQISEKASTIQVPYGKTLQDRWSKRSQDGVEPFSLLDSLDCTANEIGTVLTRDSIDSHSILRDIVSLSDGLVPADLLASSKLVEKVELTLAGLLVGSTYNSVSAIRESV